MLQWPVFVLTIILLGYLAVKKPLWLVPSLAVAVALEISINWYPNLGFLEKILGEVSLTRLTSIVLILAAFSRVFFSEEMRKKLRVVLKDPLTLVLLVFIILGGISVVYSANFGNTVTETIRLLILFAVFISTALLMDKERALLPFKAVHIMALLLALVSFYEGITGNLIWQGDKLLVEQTLRVNATFVDPNIFARYIILGIASNFVLQIYTRERSHKLIYMACLAVLLAELVLTGSRGGFLTLLAILIATLIFLPNKKAVLWVLGLGALCGVLVIFLRPEIWERMLTMTKGFAYSSEQRLYLWKAAIAIFKDHPLIGTGLGTFETVFKQSYFDLMNIPGGAIRSHTTILTIASELGAVGLAVLTAIWAVILYRLAKLFSLGHDYLGMFQEQNQYFAGTGYVLWAATVFISSQAEGRFFEDPIFWLSCAMLVVLKLSRKYRLELD
ncbi:O-antigen ligase family protein [Dehalobacter sp. TeCB1]|uniref:O-antigen ligase family protein n=1 Tax=Dehalobacter sp. TeCB1 TaxID=1843715 RepID=UPI00083A0587|nr:O-antigen ligase family protein [Dehalobacter sp. TeCB1]OCZ49683.1 polymerase [Dehalobacter sp. TeCB1]